MGRELVNLSVGEDVIKMQETSVFVFGDLILDTYVSGKVSRISPEAPVPVVVEDKAWAVLGGAANVAANIAGFGATAFLAGRIGADVDGDRLLEICGNYQINVGAVLRSSQVPTIRKLRVMAGYQQLVRVDAEFVSDLTDQEQQKILSEFQSFVKSTGPKSFVISDYGKGACCPGLLKDMIAGANANKVAVITDPKSLDLKRYIGSDIIKPNLSEGRSLLKVTNPNFKFANLDEEVAGICQVIIDSNVAKDIVLSLSEKGVMATGKSFATPEHYSSVALQVADVSGAGDTMIAFLAMGIAANLTISRAVQLANIASGIVCTKLGTATVTASEFLYSFKNKTEETSPEKILRDDELTDILEQARSAKQKIVFTNGCFDLLHAGHVETLQKSKSFGDILVVAINSDASVRRLKGPTRPLQSEQDRARIMAALACVDFVTIFDDETPLRLINHYRPSVLVKGGDWPEDKIVGAKEVRKTRSEEMTSNDLTSILVLPFL